LGDRIRWKWASIALLTIMVPMSLLVTIRLTRVLPEPKTPENVIAEPVNWNMSRPKDIIRVNEKIRNFYVDEVASVDLRILVDYYTENDWTYAFGKDLLRLFIYTNTSVFEGFIESLDIYFREEGNSSMVWIYQDPDWISLVNLKIRSITDRYYNVENDIKAYIKAVSVNQPKYVYMSRPIGWQLLDQNNLNHELEIALEFTYRNGPVYKKVMMPIFLQVYATELVESRESYSKHYF
jgi:hypothetical protein